jgi:hypothetical protein
MKFRALAADERGVTPAEPATTLGPPRGSRPGVEQAAQRGAEHVDLAHVDAGADASGLPRPGNPQVFREYLEALGVGEQLPAMLQQFEVEFVEMKRYF